LELHVGLAEEFRLESVIVPDEEFEEALLAGLVSPAASVDNFRPQIARIALNLGRKFKIDTAHAQQVAGLCATLFEQLQDLHALGRRESLILTAAALLHESGHLIGSRDHHLHSLYIMRNNEIFGLDQQDTLVAALVARYHRGAVPSIAHAEYLQLDREQRLVVSKLAALLRVADSLDRGRGLRVGIRRTREETDRLIIELEGLKDTSAVQLALNRKAGLFTSVFGLDIVVEVAAGLPALSSHA
jgi:exopolyphosphatase/guanosine-5'-triphosphate,3'-diphosphate pyrophosphatase